MAVGTNVASQQSGGGDYSSIEIGNPNKIEPLVASIREQLDRVPPSAFGENCCIYRVHEKFRKINANAYMPDTVAIGPFHHGEERFKAMEQHKLRYVHALFAQTTPQENKLEECVNAMRTLEEETRKCYLEPINLDSDEFLKMLLVDGLFIVELFRKNLNNELRSRDDPIFNTAWGMASIVRDMILIENQLPMFVLKRLFSLTTVANQGDHSLTLLALHFFNSLMPRDDNVFEQYSDREGKHLLDLFGKTLHDFPQEKPTSNQTWKFMPCVMELRQAGVMFKKGSTTGSFLDIKFSNGELEIPPLLIQDQTETLLRNLIASEQCRNQHATYITSYAFFMDSLINSADDVKFLRRHEIIINYLGEDEEVSSLFNKLCNEVTLVNFYYAKVCDEVNSYYKTRWHVWRATLMGKYFHSPWAILSFIAAILLLFFTFTGTLFSILSFALRS